VPLVFSYKKSGSYFIASSKELALFIVITYLQKKKKLPNDCLLKELSPDSTQNILWVDLVWKKPTPGCRKGGARCSITVKFSWNIYFQPLAWARITGGFSCTGPTTIKSSRYIYFQPLFDRGLSFFMISRAKRAADLFNNLPMPIFSSKLRCLKRNSGTIWGLNPCPANFFVEIKASYTFKL